MINGCVLGTPRGQDREPCPCETYIPGKYLTQAAPAGWEARGRPSAKPQASVSRGSKVPLGPQAAGGAPGAGAAAGAAGWAQEGSPVAEMALPAPNSALERDSSLKGFPAALSLKYTLLVTAVYKEWERSQMPRTGAQKAFRTSVLHNRTSLGKMLTLV